MENWNLNPDPFLFTKQSETNYDQFVVLITFLKVRLSL